MAARGPPPPATEDACAGVLADKHVLKKVEGLRKYVLGEHNKVRRARGAGGRV